MRKITGMFTVQAASRPEILAVHGLIPEFELNGADYFEARLKDKVSVSLIAWDGDKPAGYAICYMQDVETAYIWLTGTMEEYRRQGVFQMLYAEMVVWAKAQGAKRIQLKTRNVYRTMLAWLVKNGFMFMKVDALDNPQDNWIFTEKVITQDCVPFAKPLA